MLGGSDVGNSVGGGSSISTGASGLESPGLYGSSEQINEKLLILYERT